MGLKKCPICGEKFADTYKRCPFCEEDENPRRAKQPKRYNSGGRRLQRRYEDEEIPAPIYDDEEGYRPRRAAREDAYDEAPRRRADYDAYDDYEDDDYEAPRRRRRYDDGYDDDDRGSPLFKIVIILLVAVIIGCLLYLGRGVIGTLIDRDPVPTPSSSMMSDDQPEGPDDDQSADPNGGVEPNLDDPDDNGDGSGEGGDEPDQNVQSPAAGKLTLSHEDVSIDGGEKFNLSARSGSGTVTYTSKDPSIATVSASGVVTGVKKGTTEITVQRGSDSAVCIVRVRNTASGGDDDDTQTPTAAPTLNKTDITLSVGESFTLKVQGITTEITWSTANSSAVTVDGSGKVTGVAAGTTTVTASWDGQKAECIVRVKAS